MKKNQTFTVTIENGTVEGYGVCRAEDRAVFVAGALPGEVWEILILKVTSSAVWAKGLHCLIASPERCPNDCPNPCGGCTLRHADYAAELKIKQAHVEDCLRRIGKLESVSVPIHPSPEAFRYRNKAVFAVGQGDGKAVFGFYRPRSHDIVAITDCLLQSRLSISAAGAVVRFLNEQGIPPYQEETGKGTVRHIFFRQSRRGDAVLCIVSAKGFGSRTRDLTDFLRRTCPELTGIVLNINKTAGNTVLAGDFYTLWGEPNVTETFCGHSFEISPQAFLQVNPPQAEAIYRKAAEYASGLNRLPGKGEQSERKSGNLALELYCGAGTASLCLSDSFNKVIGAEIVPEAVENAKQNALRNGVRNVEFLCADAGEIAERFSAEGLRPEAVLVDPPRKGLTEQVIGCLAGLKPERIVYISCNPATLARDLQSFSRLGFTADTAEAFDMFPRTGHVETVCLLTHKG